MTREQVHHLVTVARFAAVASAHEFRHDLERGVYSRQTLAIIAVMTFVTIVALARGEWALSIMTGAIAIWMSYLPARADRRWRDETRVDP